jgi:hypothetical protein
MGGASGGESLSSLGIPNLGRTGSSDDADTAAQQAAAEEMRKTMVSFQLYLMSCFFPSIKKC